MKTLKWSWFDRSFQENMQKRKVIQNVGFNFLKRWEYQTTWPASWETCVQVRKQQLELDI